MQVSDLRQTLALVFCDMTGTTRLISQEGDLVSSAVLHDFFEHSGHLAKEHHCTLMKFIGDGFLACFETIENVLPFVATIQNLLDTLPTFAGRGLGFRFSLHHADVLYVKTSYGSDVFGEAVNLVARLEGTARPGEIVITQAAFDRMPAEQQASAGSGEIVPVRAWHSRPGTEDVKIYRIRLRAS
jgi:class 3 adenylate cyclase